MKLRHTTLLPLIGVLLACAPLESSDLDQFRLRVGLVDHLGLHGHRVLVGTRFELTIENVTTNDVEYDFSCVASSTTGVVSKIDDEEFMIDAAGLGTIEFAAPDDSCPHLAELGPDRWTATGVEPSDATALWIGGGDHFVMSRQMSPGPEGMFPEDIGRPLDHSRVAADGEFVLLPALVDQSAGERAEIRWQSEDAVLDLPEEYEALMMHADDYGGYGGWYEHALDGRLRAGDSFVSSITILGNEFALPEVEAVPTHHIAELQLVPVYLPSNEPERDWGLPVGIVAMVRDGEGHRVLGAPIEWSVASGDVYAVSGFFGDDLLEVEDCGDTPTESQWRSATVEATIEGLYASAELEWLAIPSDEQFEPDSDECASVMADDSTPDDDGSACDCSTTAAPHDAAIAAWSLLGLAAVRLLADRRRRVLVRRG